MTVRPIKVAMVTRVKTLNTDDSRCTHRSGSERNWEDGQIRQSSHVKRHGDGRQPFEQRLPCVLRVLWRMRVVMMLMVMIVIVVVGVSQGKAVGMGMTLTMRITV